jgi:uncharacterized protein (TIGR02266 family)
MAECRRDLAVPIRVTLTRPGGEQSKEYAVNLSAGGVCLHVREPLDAGTRVRLEFELPSDAGSLHLDGRVVWCTHDGERGDLARFCEMGIQFEGLPAALRDRLARFAAEVADSRR